jgi:adenylate kinase
MSVRVVFLGPPGAGKGTQADVLAAEAAVPHIATGDMLREAAAKGTPLGLAAKRYMDSGALVPDDVVIGLVGERLSLPDAERGWVLDGFPRTVAQAEALDTLLRERGTDIERVVFFDVPRAELLRRLTGRRVCPQCGATYHLESAPPRHPGVCDRCGAALEQRVDDGEAAVAKRLDVYETQTAPLLDYYERRGVLSAIDGQGALPAVAGAVRRALGETETVRP